MFVMVVIRSSNFVHVSSIYLISSVENVKAVSSDLNSLSDLWFVRESVRLKSFSLDVATLFNNSDRE